MKEKNKKSLYWLIGLLIVVAFAVVMAYQVRSDFGKVDVSYVKIKTPQGYSVAARLYRPVYATAENKLPAVITIHGWNNDKDTQAPASIELARRGFVVLNPDANGQGDSDGPYDRVKPEFKLLGIEYAYDWLITQPFVDATQIGITGHSMGAGLSRDVARVRPDIQAVVMQCSVNPVKDFDYRTLHNFLGIWAAWEELSTVNGGVAERRVMDPTWYKGFGFTEPFEWGQNYGSFADNTAFQISLNRSTHPGMPPSHQMITTLLDWMRMALKDGVRDENWIESVRHIYAWYDIFMGLALLAALGSTIPLANLLLTVPFFKPVATPMPKKYVAKPKEWWKMAIINALIAAITYPPLTTFGRSTYITSSPFLNSIFTNGIPNGLAFWAFGNVIIFAVMFYFWYRKNSKENKITMYDLGVSFEEKKTKLDWVAIGKSALLASVLVIWLYAMVSITQSTLGIEFRVEFGLLKQFAIPGRFISFFVWLVPLLLLFLMNNGLFLFGQARQKEYESEVKTQLIWWLKNCFAALGGLALLLFLQYAGPMMFNFPVFLDLIGYNQAMVPLKLTGGSMMVLQLFMLIPFTAVLLFFATYYFRKTGKIYLGAFFVAMVIAWAWAVGTQFNQLPWL